MSWSRLPDRVRQEGSTPRAYENLDEDDDFPVHSPQSTWRKGSPSEFSGFLSIFGFTDWFWTILKI